MLIGGSLDNYTVSSVPRENYGVEWIQGPLILVTAPNEHPLSEYDEESCTARVLNVSPARASSLRILN